MTLTTDPEAGERGRFGRLPAYVEFAGQDFGASLLKLGFARLYREGEASREPDYLELEAVAREDGKGLWGECKSDLAEPSPAPSEIESDAAASTLCDSAYPDVCIPPPPPDLDCGDIPHTNFSVLPPDPHRFDGDGDERGAKPDDADCPPGHDPSCKRESHTCGCLVPELEYVATRVPEVSA